jgi:sporulation protein YlmC with PRC-barrel domain
MEVDSMETTKRNTLPFKDTVELSDVVGKKVLTKEGKDIGKVKSVHMHPRELTIEGIVVDPGFFDAYQFIGAGYIGSITDEGIVLNINPVTEYVGVKVFDYTGKEIGKVKEVNRSKQTNTLLSILVDRRGEEDALIRADHIAAAGKNIVLKEPYPF